MTFFLCRSGSFRCRKAIFHCRKPLFQRRTTVFCATDKQKGHLKNKRPSRFFETLKVLVSIVSRPLVAFCKNQLHQCRQRFIFILLQKRQCFFNSSLQTVYIFSAGSSVKRLTSAATFNFFPGFTNNLSGI